MMIALEGIAGSGKTTLRDRLLESAAAAAIPITHVGQFSWLSLSATRTLVNLRTRRAPVTHSDATAAVTEDLTLHARHNLTLAGHRGHVLADRLVLSTAALLELTHPGTLETQIRTLARIGGARADLTVLLTTPTEICTRRLSARTAAARPGDDPATADRLHSIYERCAEIWQQVTAKPVIRRSLETPDHTEELARHLLAVLRKAHR